MTQLYKLQFFNENWNKWMGSSNRHRGSLAKMERLALWYTETSSLSYRAAPVKVAKAKKKR
jgi:hypothetical protein